MVVLPGFPLSCSAANPGGTTGSLASLTFFGLVVNLSYSVGPDLNKNPVIHLSSLIS